MIKIPFNFNFLNVYVWNLFPPPIFSNVYNFSISLYPTRLSSLVFTVVDRGCNNIAGLVKEQKALCRQNPALMEVIGLGAKLGLQECQHQFATSKWNCSHMDQRKKGLLGLLTSKGKQKVFSHHITSLLNLQIHSNLMSIFPLPLPLFTNACFLCCR